jgi:hypothetical protein
MIRTLFAAALLFTSPALAGDDTSTGVLSLSSQPMAAPSGCTTLVSGGILKTQGSLALDKPSHFSLHRCVDAANLPNEALWLSGPLEQFDAFTRATPLEDRAYLLKVSHYTNSDPAGRNAELVAINERITDRPDRYFTEAFLRVTDAVGLARPDEVVLISYDSAAAGARFRANSGDVMQMIGAFNDVHLGEYSYLIAELDP